MEDVTRTLAIYNPLPLQKINIFNNVVALKK